MILPPPQLWVWIGSPDDKLDVMRYVRATNSDIRRQPVVVAEIDQLRARIAELSEMTEGLRQELGKAQAALVVVREYVEDNPYGYPCSIMDNIRRGLSEYVVAEDAMGEREEALTHVTELECNLDTLIERDR